MRARNLAVKLLKLATESFFAKQHSGIIFTETLCIPTFLSDGKHHPAAGATNESIRSEPSE